MTAVISQFHRRQLGQTAPFLSNAPVGAGDRGPGAVCSWWRAFLIGHRCPLERQSRPAVWSTRLRDRRGRGYSPSLSSGTAIARWGDRPRRQPCTRDPSRSSSSWLRASPPRLEGLTSRRTRTCRLLPRRPANRRFQNRNLPRTPRRPGRQPARPKGAPATRHFLQSGWVHQRLGRRPPRPPPDLRTLSSSRRTGRVGPRVRQVGPGRRRGHRLTRLRLHPHPPPRRTGSPALRRDPHPAERRPLRMNPFPRRPRHLIRRLAMLRHRHRPRNGISRNLLCRLSRCWDCSSKRR